MLKRIFCLVMFACLINSAKTQGNPPDSIAARFNTLLKSSDPDDQAVLQKELYGLLKKKDENDWLLARNFFYQMKKGEVVDSIDKAVVKKFPLGMMARSAATSAIYEEKDAVKMEKMYRAWMKKFPAEKFEGERILYDYVRANLGTKFAQQGNAEKAVYYAGTFETGPWSGEGKVIVARALMANGQKPAAKELIKQAVDIAHAYMNEKKNEPKAGFAAMGYPSYCEMYADMLMEEGKYNEALPFLEEGKKYGKSGLPSITRKYAQTLIMLNRDLEAYLALSRLLADGQGNDSLKTELKKLYVKLNGTDAGYARMEEDMQKEAVEELRAKLQKEMISEKAASFTMKDMAGKQVSLGDYKGKVVVLDFWATWCGPCKRSFPAMQMAVDKYANDEDVHFLFIDTWENVSDFEPLVEDFIKQNKYGFHVVYDPRDAQTKESPVAEAYDVSGIPAKFVIDGNGNIRFKMSGFSGGNEAAVMELSEMIEMAKKS